MRTHVGKKAYKCTECDYPCMQVGHLKRYMKPHTVEKNLTNVQNVNIYAYKVGILKSHMRTHTGEISYKCIERD